MDNRTPLERMLDKTIGLPLYYCNTCKRPATISADNVIHRKCSCTGTVNAPRIALLRGSDKKFGEIAYRFKVWRMQLIARLTQRCVGFHQHAPTLGEMSAGISGGSSLGAS